MASPEPVVIGTTGLNPGAPSPLPLSPGKQRKRKTSNPAVLCRTQKAVGCGAPLPVVPHTGPGSWKTQSPPWSSPGSAACGALNAL